MTLSLDTALLLNDEQIAQGARALIPAHCPGHIPPMPKNLKMRERSAESFVSSARVINEISIEDQRSVRLIRIYRAMNANFATHCPPPPFNWPGDGTPSEPGKFPGDIITGGTEVPDLEPTEHTPPLPPLPENVCDNKLTINERMKNFLSMGQGELLAHSNLTDILLDGSADRLTLRLSDLPLLRAYNDTLLLGNDEAALLKYFETNVKGHLTSDQSMLLVQMKLERWYMAFDKKRSDKSLTAKGVVTISQLMAAEQSNNSIDYFGYLGGDATYAKYAGICRDVMSAGGRLLQAAGFPNVMVLSYVKTDAYHTTIALQDPENPYKVHKINWGDRITADGVEGGQALFQGGADASAQYYLSEPGGRTVAIVPSEFGKTSFAAAGFTLEDLDPLLSQKGAMLKIKDSGHGVDLFTAQDGNGASYIGVSKNKQWGTQENGTKVGVVAGIQHRPGAAYGIAEDVNYDYVYAQLEKRGKNELVNFADPKIKASVEHLFRAILTAGRDRESGGINPWVYLSHDLNLVVEGGDKNSQAGGKIKAGAQLHPGIADVRNNHWNQMPIGTINHILFSAEGRLRLSKSREGKAFLKAATYVLVDYFSKRGKAVAGFENGRLSVTAALEGRLDGKLDKDTPLYKEGNLKKVRGNAKYKIKKGVDFEVDAYRTIENDPQFQDSTSVMGNITIER